MWGWLLALVVGHAAGRPNFLWIMADDLGWGEVGLFPASSPHGRISTPHLDTFGREGLVFKEAYAGYTVCAPSRTTFFTGRHSGNFKAAGLNGEGIDPEKNVSLLPRVLKQAGYRTGLFGKSAPLTSPLQQGFDAFLGQVDQALCHNMYPKDIDHGMEQLNFKLSGNDKPKSRELCMNNPDLYNYTIDVFHESAMQWLEEAAKGEEPFFLYVSYTIPHAGGWGDAPKTPEDGNPVPSDLQYADKPWPDVEKDHAAVITYLDAKVGDIMARLKFLGVDQNTLVFFASDNGAHLEGGHKIQFFDSTGGLPGHKRSMYEGGVRSPSMVRWPGRIQPGRSSNFPWAFWDVLPTLAELAGAPVPPGLDGLSIAQELTGLPQKEHEYLYFTWLGDGGKVNSGPPGYTVRQGQWKGMVPHCQEASVLPSSGDEMRLYDLSADPLETTDVSKQHPEVVQGLKALVMKEKLTCYCYQCGWTPPKEPAELVV
ncbi:unnamed protein product [Effrenium voratum]|nr:unnamed protein product [Effrenium voratum]